MSERDLTELHVRALVAYHRLMDAKRAHDKALDEYHEAMNASFKARAAEIQAAAIKESAGE